MVCRKEGKRGRFYISHPAERRSRPAPVSAVMSTVDSQTDTRGHKGRLERGGGGGGVDGAGIMLVTRNFRVIISNYQFMDNNEQNVL